MKSVGVLILNYVSFEETLTYVANLKRQQQIRLSILIVDNCSPNESFQVLSESFENDPVVTVISSERNGGYAYGNNYGLRYWEQTHLDFILISNNDISLDNDRLIAQLVDEYQRCHRPALIAPKMFVHGREDQKHQAWRLPTILDSYFLSLRTTYAVAKWAGRSNGYSFPEKDHTTRAVDCLNGSFFLVAKPLIYGLGMLDEHTFLYCEESILGQEIKHRDYFNYLVRSLHFHHYLGATTSQLHSKIRLQRYWLQSTLYYHRKYDGLSIAAALPLYLLFGIWVFETLVHRLVMSFRKH